MILRGYKKFHHREKNKDYHVLNFTDPFQDQKGIGEEFITEFVNEKIFAALRPEFIGKNVDLIKSDKFAYGFYVEGKKVL